MEAGKLLLILKLEENVSIWSGRIVDVCPSFVSSGFELGRTWLAGGVDRQSCMREHFQASTDQLLLDTLNNHKYV